MHQAQAQPVTLTWIVQFFLSPRLKQHKESSSGRRRSLGVIQWCHWHLSTQLCGVSLTPLYENSAAMVMDALFCTSVASWQILENKKTKRVSLKNKNEREKNQQHIPRIVDSLSESCGVLLTVRTNSLFWRTEDSWLCADWWQSQPS